MSISVTQDLPSLTQLPDSYLMQLSDYSAIALSGEDQSSYLQGQVTCDVNASSETNLLHGAHCDAKGKVYSVFRLINRYSNHLLVQPQACLASSMAALQKFGVFSKVEISKADNLAFYALAGEQSTTILSQTFNQIPDSLTPVVQQETTTLVYIAGTFPRYLIIDEQDNFDTLLTKFALPIYSHKVWQLLEITQGFPVLSEEASQQFVPQMLNLQAINGISFTKGCYLGQETVARMQYLGKNKRALFSLSGALTGPLADADSLEKQLGENWRKAGEITTSYQADDGNCYIQAVLANDDEITSLRLKAQPNSLFTVKELPYSLTADQ